LLNQAKERHEELQLVLMRYAIERLLYRLSVSRNSGRFILKGAMLFTIWGGRNYRATHDLDLLGYGASDVPQLEAIFRELCTVSVEDDGLIFIEDETHGRLIRETQEYGGVRIQMLATLGKARIPVQIDIGFGDVITPSAQQISFPTLLDFPAPQVRAYPRETVVAEKFEALVRLGMANTRMKDFYDLWALARNFQFEGAQLGAAIKATFERRATPIPTADSEPIALTSVFGGANVKQAQWRAFLRKAHLNSTAPSLDEAITALRLFLLPPAIALTVDQAPFDLHWLPGGPWQPLEG